MGAPKLFSTPGCTFKFTLKFSSFVADTNAIQWYESLEMVALIANKKFWSNVYCIIMDIEMSQSNRNR